MALAREKANLFTISHSDDGELHPLQQLQTTAKFEAGIMRGVLFAVKLSEAKKTSQVTDGVREMIASVEQSLCSAGADEFINQIRERLSMYTLWQQKVALLMSSTFDAYDKYHQVTFAFVEVVDSNIISDDTVNMCQSINVVKPLAAIVIENDQVFVLARSCRDRNILAEFSSLEKSDTNSGITSTSQLVDALRSYANAIELDQNESQELYRQVSYELLEQDASPTIESLDEFITSFTGDETQFSEHAKAESFEIDLNAPIKKRILSQLTKCQGQGKGVSIGFNTNLIDDRVHYDITNNTLTIENPPPAIVEQIKQVRAASNE